MSASVKVLLMIAAVNASKICFICILSVATIVPPAEPTNTGLMGIENLTL